ncbi:MAG: hypothetical protein M1812_001443 [Candelaria pacifica]|nr:MAG: hypothetical protein M1812_001443 [Candelaria pacifica]
MANARFLVLAFVLAIFQCLLLPGLVSAAPLKLTDTSSDPANRAAQNSFVRQLVDPIPAMYGTATAQVAKGSPLKTTRVEFSTPTADAGSVLPSPVLEEGKPRFTMPDDVKASVLAVEKSILAAVYPRLPRTETIYKGGVPIKTLPGDSILTVGPRSATAPYTDGDAMAPTATGVTTSEMVWIQPTAPPSTFGAASMTTPLSLGKGKPSAGLPSNGQLSFRAEPMTTSLSFGSGKPLSERLLFQQIAGLLSDGELSFEVEPTTTALSHGEDKPFPGLPSDGQLSFGARSVPTSLFLDESKPFAGIPSNGELSFGAEPTPISLPLGESKPYPGMPTNGHVTFPILPRSMVTRTIYPSMNTSLPAIATVNFEISNKRSAGVATSTLPDGREILLPTIQFIVPRATTTVTGVALLGDDTGVLFPQSTSAPVLDGILAMPGPVMLSEGLEELVTKTRAGV